MQIYSEIVCDKMSIFSLSLLSGWGRKMSRAEVEKGEKVERHRDSQLKMNRFNEVEGFSSVCTLNGVNIFTSNSFPSAVW
jgi:hypothetical protein